MLDRAFFQLDPVTCAQELIGCELVWDSCAGIIVETEAYAALGDEACHTFARPSARAFIANHDPGAAYVYFNYGIYWLFNVLVKGGREEGFVLIRALEPTAGIPTMQNRRLPRNAAPHPVQSLCSGPGKLTIALGIDGRQHGRDLCADPRHGFRQSSTARVKHWVSDVRIGISKAAHLPWRFLAEGNDFVSMRPRLANKSIVRGSRR